MYSENEIWLGKRMKLNPTWNSMESLGVIVDCVGTVVYIDTKKRWFLAEFDIQYCEMWQQKGKIREAFQMISNTRDATSATLPKERNGYKVKRIFLE